VLSAANRSAAIQLQWPNTARIMVEDPSIYDDLSSVPLSNYERTNVGAIKEAEGSKGC
jgi:hypothetical protein